MIIRNTELATAQEKFEEVEKQYKEVHACCSPYSLLDKLQGIIYAFFYLIPTCTPSGSIMTNAWIWFSNRGREGGFMWSYLTIKYLFAFFAGAANDADDDSENLHRKLLSGEIELGEFIQKYRKQRILFHRRTLIRMAALTSLTTPG